MPPILGGILHLTGDNLMRLLLTLLLLGGFILQTLPAHAQTYVRGYTRRDGTYVQGHYRSRPDSSVYNNYSTRGNVNPYTGQRGTVNPHTYRQQQQRRRQRSNFY